MQCIVITGECASRLRLGFELGSSLVLSVVRARAGESGSGKTEAARVCLQCAVVAGAGAGGAGGALTAAGTLLEAFGNAATVRNHNASRFVSLVLPAPCPSY